MRQFCTALLGVGILSLPVLLIGCGNEQPPQAGAPAKQNSDRGGAVTSDSVASIQDQAASLQADAPLAQETAKQTDVHPTVAAPPTTPAANVGAPSPSTADTTAQDSQVATFAGLTAPKPATWISHPPARQFSVAEYAVPGRDGYDQARIDVFIAGGSIQMNIDRWKGQFRSEDGSPVEPKIENLDADDMEITLVEFNGAYRGMGAVNFAPDQLFLCAIVQAPAGQTFVRFVGPSGTVEPNRQAYLEMIRGLRRIEPMK